MDSLNFAASIREAKEEIRREYEKGTITEEEMKYRIEHGLGFQP